MTIPYGIHPDAFKAYIDACFEAKINPSDSLKPNGTHGSRVLQTIGDAPASAGYHAADGVYILDGRTHPYCAAVDIRSRDLSTAEIERLLMALIKHGWAPWWRHTGSFANNQHIHMDFLGIPMKRQLRNQAHSFFALRSGLVGDDYDPFLKAHMTPEILQPNRVLFLAHNRPVGLGKVGEDIWSYDAHDLPAEDGCHLDENGDGIDVA